MGLTHWLLGDVAVILRLWTSYSPNRIVTGHLLWNCSEVNAMNLINKKTTLVQVMAWCRYCLSYCWSRSVLPYGVTRTQCVNTLVCVQMEILLLWWWIACSQSWALLLLLSITILYTWWWNHRGVVKHHWPFVWINHISGYFSLCYTCVISTHNIWFVEAQIEEINQTWSRLYPCGGVTNLISSILSFSFFAELLKPWLLTKYHVL